MLENHKRKRESEQTKSIKWMIPEIKSVEDIKE